jgi:hypothetical protein
MKFLHSLQSAEKQYVPTSEDPELINDADNEVEDCKITLPQTSVSSTLMSSPRKINRQQVC